MNIDTSEVAALVKTAAHETDLDKALIPLQNHLGIESGDVASIHFSGVEWIDNRLWAVMDINERRAELHSYLRTEVVYTEAYGE